MAPLLVLPGMQFEHEGVPRTKSGRIIADVSGEHRGGDDEEDDLGMAPPGLARLVGVGKPTGDPRLVGNNNEQRGPSATLADNSNASATAPVVAAAAAAGGIRGGRGRRGGRGAAPLGTPHARGGGNGGSGGRPPRVGQHQQEQQQQKQQQLQHLEQEKQLEKREEEEYERELVNQQQQQQQELVAGVPAVQEDAEGIFAATRNPTVDYDSLAPPGL